MEKKTRKATQKIVVQRNKYTTEHREKARKYYLIGLNLHEISLLLCGCPVRTIERWQLDGKWTGLKQPENLKLRAKELHDAGKTCPLVCLGTHPLHCKCTKNKTTKLTGRLL